MGIRSSIMDESSALNLLSVAARGPEWKTLPLRDAAGWIAQKTFLYAFGCSRMTKRLEW